MSDLVQLNKDLMEIDIILKSILVNEEWQDVKIREIKESAGDDNDILTENNYINYFTELLI